MANKPTTREFLLWRRAKRLQQKRKNNPPVVGYRKNLQEQNRPLLERIEAELRKG